MGGLPGQLALIIDPEVSYSDLPSWLQRCKAIVQPRPSQATRDVQHALFDLMGRDLKRPFVGRDDLRRDFGQSVADMTRRRRVLVASGLDGVGRRTYLERAASDYLSLHLGPVFHVDETTGLEDLYLWVLDETADLKTRASVRREREHFIALNQAMQVKEIASRLHVLCADGCMPCLVDMGGLLGERGDYHRAYSDLIRSFLDTEEDHYLAFLHRRRPLTDDLPSVDEILLQRVGPLAEHECRVLLQQLLRRAGKTPETRALEEVASYLDGYPPACYFSVSYAQEYGFANLLADKSMLEDFKVRKFSRFISELQLPEDHWAVLQYLASERLVPLTGIATATGKDSSDIALVLRDLIDRSLVVVDDDNYGVSGPLRSAIFRARGYLSREDYQEILQRLARAFWSEENVAPAIAVVDATLHAVAMSGSSDFSPYHDLVGVSAVHRMALDCYHRREWPLALEYATRAQQMAPDRAETAVLRFKSLVQLERWNDAEGQLRGLERMTYPRVHYLRGFMLRKRRRYVDACKAFQSALDTGDLSHPVYRDYADCLHRCGRYDEAMEKIQYVLRRDPENIFVLDLVVRICIDKGDIATAAAYLKDLERYDLDERFIHHRKASYHLARNEGASALLEADAASKTGHAPFEVFALRVNVMIEIGRYDDAYQALEELRSRFQTGNMDVQLGLRCKLLTREGKWREAMTVWEQIREKTTPVHQGLLQSILEAKAGDPEIGLAERESARAEAAALADRGGPGVLVDVETDLD
jgi:tetratricopeptide (TPR) repeat protein